MKTTAVINNQTVVFELPELTEEATSEFVSLYVQLMRSNMGDFSDPSKSHARVIQYLMQIDESLELPKPIWEYLAFKNAKYKKLQQPLIDGSFELNVDGLRFRYELPPEDQIIVILIDLEYKDVEVHVTKPDFLGVFQGELFMKGEGRKDLDLPVTVTTTESTQPWACPKGKNQVNMYVAGINDTGDIIFWSGSIPVDDLEVIQNQSVKVEVLGNQH